MAITTIKMIRNEDGTFVNVNDLQAWLEDTAVACDEDMDDEKENPVLASTVIRNIAKQMNEFKA